MVAFRELAGLKRLLVREGPLGTSERLLLWLFSDKAVPGGTVGLQKSWNQHLGAYVVCGVPATDLSAFEKQIAKDHKAMQDQIAKDTKDPDNRPLALFIWYEDPDKAIAAGPTLDRPMVLLQRSKTALYRRAFSLRNQFFDLLGDGVIGLQQDDAGRAGFQLARPGNFMYHYGLIIGGNLDAPDRAKQIATEVHGPVFVPMEGPHTGSLSYDVKIDPGMMVAYGGDVRFFTDDNQPRQRRYPVLDLWSISQKLAHTARINPAAPCDPDRTRLALASTSGGYPTSLVSVLGRRVRLNPQADAGWTFQPIRTGLAVPKAIQKALRRKTAPELYYLSPVGDWTIEQDTTDTETAVRVLCGANGTEFLNARPGDVLRFEANKPATAAPPQTANATAATGSNASGAALADDGCRTSWATMIPASRQASASHAGGFPFGYFAQPLSSVAYGSVGEGHVDASRADLALLGAYGVQLSALGDGSKSFPVAPFGGITQEGNVTGLGGWNKQFAKLPLNESIRSLDFAGFERTVISPVRQATVTPNADGQGQSVGPRFVANAAPSLGSAPQGLLGGATSDLMALGAAPEDGQQGLTPQGLVGAYAAGSLTWQRLIFARDMSKGTGARGTSRQDLAFENGLNPRLGDALMNDNLFLVISNTANIGPIASLAGDAARSGVEIKFQNSFLVPGSRQKGRAPEDIFKITVDLAAPGEARRSVLIAKYAIGQSVKAFVDNLGQWTQPGDFNDEGKDKGTYPVQAFLQQVINEAIAAVGGGDRTIGSANSDARWLKAFAQTVQDENWTGILAIDCPVPGGGLPEELLALRGGMTQPLKAHHMGVSANQVKFSKAEGGAAVSIDVAESAIFGLIQYPPLLAKPPTFPDLDAPQDYLVRELDILFANSAIADFFCEIHLLINNLFGRDVELSAPAKRASGEPLEHNVIPIFGYYADHDGEKQFSFVAPGTSTYTMKQLETDPLRRVLNAVRIDSAVFRVTSQTPESSGIRIRARFGLTGGLSFNVLGGDMDLFGYAGDSALPVAGMNIDVAFSLGSDGTVDPTTRKVTFSLADARVDKNHMPSPRAGSIQGNLPLALHAFRTNAEKLEEGLDAGALNATVVHSSALGDETTAAPQYVLQFALPLGDFGNLASTKIAFTANVYLGWGPQETSPDNDGVGVFLDLPLPVPGIAGFNLQGVLHTNFGTINLDRVMRTPKNGSKEPPQPLYVLTFSNVTIGFLVFKLPPGQMVNFYIFGDPESKSPADSNIAWLLAVKDKDKDKDKDKGGGG